MSQETNGADIMRPGITKIDPDIKKGDVIRIIEETKHRALAVLEKHYLMLQKWS